MLTLVREKRECDITILVDMVLNFDVLYSRLFL